MLDLAVAVAVCDNQTQVANIKLLISLSLSHVRDLGVLFVSSLIGHLAWRNNLWTLLPLVPTQCGAHLERRCNEESERKSTTFFHIGRDRRYQG